MDVPQFIHSPTEVHLSCFQVLAAVSEIAIHIYVQVFLNVNFQFTWVKNWDRDQWVTR